MVTRTLCSIVLLLQAIFTVTWSQEPIDMCACRYRFVEQPSNSLICNPYPTGQFITRCIVAYSTSEGIPLNVLWHSRRHSNEAPQSLTSGFTTTTEFNRVQSVLTIELIQGMEQNYESFQYSCSVHFSNGTLITNSQEVFLFPRSVLNSMNGFDFPACDENSAQSTRIEECIDPNYPPTTPPPTTPPPTTPSPTTPPPTTPPPTTTVPTDPTTPPPTTTMAPPSTTSDPPSSPPPTTPSPTTPPPTTPPPPVTTRQVSQNPLTFEEEILLYSAIVAAVILVVVIVVLVLCLCCWNRVCQRSRYCTCYSKY